MLRRVVAHAVALPALCRRLTVSADIREGLTKPLSSLKEECKGQNLDLADMAEAMKGATHRLQDAIQKSAVADKQFKGKVTTLSASLKAYNTRLANLQSETRSIQAEVDAVMKLLWGTERPEGASFASPPEEKVLYTTESFEVEPPPIARALGEEAPSAPPKPAPPKRTVERVEGERVEVTTIGSSPPAHANVKEEIEVETIEIDIEPAAREDAVETMKVTDITKELYERGVNFSDCMDARTLRQRYRDVLSGKIPTNANQPSSSASKGFTEPLTANTSQPRMPQRAPAPQHDYQYRQQQHQSSSNSAGYGITNDPYPNAHRKMVDPMKFVYQIKQELALEKGIDASLVDLWSGKIKLDDHKRLYDYPSIQSYPIEVRQKGDMPA